MGSTLRNISLFVEAAAMVGTLCHLFISDLSSPTQDLVQIDSFWVSSRVAPIATGFSAREQTIYTNNDSFYIPREIRTPILRLYYTPQSNPGSNRLLRMTVFYEYNENLETMEMFA